MKNEKNILEKTVDDLKKMSKEQVHAGYKEIIEQMLMEFYVEFSLSEPVKTVQDLKDFVNKFISDHIKPPSSAWQPGDEGK